MTGVELFTIGGGLQVGAGGAILGKTAATAFTLGDAFSVVGLLSNAVGGISQGQAAGDAAAFNARVASNQAIRERQIAERDAEDFERRQSAKRGRARALRAGSGVTPAGTPLLTEDVFLEQNLLDAETIRAGGQARASGFESQAELSRARGRSARSGGAIGAGASLLTGLGERFG